MIKAILILNTAGKVRLVRVYDDLVSLTPLRTHRLLGPDLRGGSHPGAHGENLSEEGELLQLY